MILKRTIPITRIDVLRARLNVMRDTVTAQNITSRDLTAFREPFLLFVMAGLGTLWDLRIRLSAPNFFFGCLNSKFLVSTAVEESWSWVSEKLWKKINIYQQNSQFPSLLPNPQWPLMDFHHKFYEFLSFPRHHEWIADDIMNLFL